MGPKKAAKGKKKNKKEKKPKDADQLTAVDRTFYELTITDLNNKLARLRSHCAKLEGANEEYIEKMQHFEEDRTDVTAYLNRQLTEKEDAITEMNERLEELEKVRTDEKKDANEKIKEWENKFKAMHEQLTSEIKLLNGKLNSLEEFRIQRTDLLMKFDEQEEQMKEQQLQQKQKIHEMEQEAIVERDQLKKDVQTKLVQLSEDFTKSSEIRIAGYTRRLIRENIALNKEMDKMVASQIRMETENREMKERTLEIDQLYVNSEIVKERMVKTCQNQIKIIEKLTRQYEILKSKYEMVTHYKKLYEASLTRDVCDKFSYNEMAKKLRTLSQRIEILKADKQKLMSYHQQYESEITRLNDILRNLKFTVKSAIRAEIDDTDDPEFRAEQRKNLLSELMRLLTSYTEECVLTPSVSTISDTSCQYRSGFAGLIPRKTESLFDLFKKEARKIASAELLATEYKKQIRDDKIIPKPVVLEEETLIDVESGTTIVFSTSIEEEAPPEVGLEDEQDDIPVSGSSESVERIESKTSVKEEKPNKKEKKKEKIEEVSEEKTDTIIEEEQVEEEERQEEEESKEATKVVSAEEFVKEENTIGEELEFEDEEEENDAAYFFY